jgi:hypothetical protein
MKEIFVFGSNLAGIHGAGSARYAFENYGAKFGIGVGLQGNSYAIPTKDKNFNVLPLSEIKKHVDEFLAFAKEHQEMKFNVVAIGCSLAGYKAKDIAYMFKDRTENVQLPKEFTNEKTS